MLVYCLFVLPLFVVGCLLACCDFVFVVVVVCSWFVVAFDYCSCLFSLFGDIVVVLHVVCVAVDVYCWWLCVVRRCGWLLLLGVARCCYVLRCWFVFVRCRWLLLYVDVCFCCWCVFVVCYLRVVRC